MNIIVSHCLENIEEEIDMAKLNYSIVNVSGESNSCFYRAVTTCIIAGILNNEITDDTPKNSAKILKNGLIENKISGFLSSMIRTRTKNSQYQFNPNETLKTALLKVLWIYTDNPLLENFPKQVNIHDFIEKIDWGNVYQDGKNVLRTIMVECQNYYIDSPENDLSFSDKIYKAAMIDYDTDETQKLNEREYNGISATQDEIETYKKEILNKINDLSLKRTIGLILDLSILNEDEFNKNFSALNENLILNNDEKNHLMKNNTISRAFLQKKKEEAILLRKMSLKEYQLARQYLEGDKIKLIPKEDESSHIACLQTLHFNFFTKIMEIKDLSGDKLNSPDVFLSENNNGEITFTYTKNGLTQKLAAHNASSRLEAGLTQRIIIERATGLEIRPLTSPSSVNKYEKKNEIAVYLTNRHFQAILTTKEETKKSYGVLGLKEYLKDTIPVENVNTENVSSNFFSVKNDSFLMLSLKSSSNHKKTTQYISEKKADIATSIGQKFISHIVGRQSPLVLMNDEQPISFPPIQLVARDKQNNEIKESEIELKKEQIDYYEVQVTPIAQEPFTEEAAVFSVVESLSEPPEPPKPITLMKIHHDSKITASTDWRSAFSDGLVVDTKKCEEDLIKIEAKNKASKLITMAKIMLDTFIQINDAGESDKKKTIRLSGQDEELRQVIMSLVTGEPVAGFGGSLKTAILEALNEENNENNIKRKYNGTKLYSHCIEIQKSVASNRYGFHARKERLDFNQERVVVKGPDMVSALV